MTFMSNHIHVENRNGPVKVRANHFLAVAGHHTLTRCEILRGKDGRGDDQRNVRGVDVAGLEVGAALVADEDLVTWEVRILVDREAVRDGTDCLGADGERRTDLALTVDRELGLVEHRGLEDGADVRTGDEEVRRAAEGLAVDGVRHVDDCLDEGLVPLADGTSELGTDLEGRGEELTLTGDLVDERAWATRPVVVGAVGLRDEVVEDLAVDLKRDLLRQDRGELHLGVHGVIGVEVLREFRRPASAELAGCGRDGDGLDLDVDLGDGRRRCLEVRLKRGDSQDSAGALVDRESVSESHRDPRGTSRRKRVGAGVGDLEDGLDVRAVERVGGEDATGEVTALVEAAEVEDALAGLVGLTPLSDAVVGVKAEDRDLLRGEEVDLRERSDEVLDREEAEGDVESVGREVVLDLTVVAELASVGAREVSDGLHDGIRHEGVTSAGPRTERASREGGGAAVDLGVADVDEVVHTAGRQRAGLNALTCRVVVDGLAALVGSLGGRVRETETGVTTDV